VTLDLAVAARQVLALEGNAHAPAADRVTRECERVTAHLARLVGQTGIRTLFHRSLILSSVTYPWLVDGTGGKGGPGEDPFEALRKRLLPQSADAVADAFGLVLTTFVSLLGRLIGEGLVRGLLHEVWPTVFPDAAKETP